MIGCDVVCPSYCSWARVWWTRHALWHIAVFLLMGTNSASNFVRTAGRRDLFLPPFGCAACCARTPPPGTVGETVMCTASFGRFEDERNVEDG